MTKEQLTGLTAVQSNCACGDRETLELKIPMAVRKQSSRVGTQIHESRLCLIQEGCRRNTLADTSEAIFNGVELIPLTAEKRHIHFFSRRKNFKAMVLNRKDLNC